MLASRPEPEPEHDGDVGEQRQRVPVPDRLAEPRDAISLGIEGRNDLREQRPHERRADDDRQHPGGEARTEAPADGREHDSETEERAVRDRLVEGVPAAIADDRPPHRHADPQRERDGRADEQRTRATDARNGSSPERDRHERAGQRDDRGAADRKDPADVRRVAGEHRTEENRAHEPGEGDEARAGRPDGRLRRRIHGEPR